MQHGQLGHQGLPARSGPAAQDVLPGVCLVIDSCQGLLLDRVEHGHPCVFVFVVVDHELLEIFQERVLVSQPIPLLHE